MSSVNIYMTIIAALFGLYGLCCAAETGAALKILGRDKRASALFTPLWEITNVFLVFGFTGVAVIFNGALSSLSHALLSTLAVGLIALLLRGCLALGIFYTHPSDPPRWVVWLFVAANFAIPLSFSAAGAYLLTGQLFWHTLIGWIVMFAAPVSIVSVGLGAVEHYLKSAGRSVAEVIYLIWLLIVGSALPLAVQHTNNLLQKGPIALLTLLSFIGICLVWAQRAYGWRRTWLFGPLLILVTPILLAWANRPYLVAGKLTLAQSYGAQAFSGAFLIGTAVILPLLAIGFWAFIKLLSTSPPKS